MMIFKKIIFKNLNSSYFCYKNNLKKKIRILLRRIFGNTKYSQVKK